MNRYIITMTSGKEHIASTGLEKEEFIGQISIFNVLDINRVMLMTKNIESIEQVESVVE